jgi:hypothetical protein
VWNSNSLEVQKYPIFPNRFFQVPESDKGSAISLEEEITFKDSHPPNWN